MATASAATLVVIAGGVFAAVSPGRGHGPAAGAGHGHPAPQGSSGAAARPLVPLRVLSVSPASGAQDANGAAPVRVTFNEKLAPDTPMPALSPRINGTWRASGDSAVFTPAVGWTPGTAVTLSIPGGRTGVEAAGLTRTAATAHGTATAHGAATSGGILDGATATRDTAGGAAGTSATGGIGLLAKTATVSFTTGSYSTFRLQQLLAQLGYLPLTWTPGPADASVPAGNPNAQLSAAYDPPAGSFAFQPGYPSALTSQWRTGTGNILDTGAIRAFESDQGLAMDGVAGPEVWSHLFTAIAAGQDNKHGYTYALANQHSPETLTVWHNGKVISKTLANTGIPGASTQDGTFPVYLRYQVTQMKGTNPNGTPYDDTVYWVSYFNGGDAVHYFARPGYGYYQSLGCVELQLAPAKFVWPYMTYGTLVTVTGPVALSSGRGLSVQGGSGPPWIPGPCRGAAHGVRHVSRRAGPGSGPGSGAPVLPRQRGPGGALPGQARVR